MKGLVRALLAAIGVVGLVVVVAVIYITTFFDPNDLKPRLIDAVRDQSGLELRLDGPLSWSFYPRIGVSVEDAEAWLPGESRDDEPFVAFDSAEVSVAFAPLLTGDLSVDGLILDGMRLNLSRDAQGRGNWQVLMDRLAQGEASSEAPARQASVSSHPASMNDASPDDGSRPAQPASAGPGLSKGDGQPVAFDVASVKVSNSRVHYVDPRRPLDVTLTNLALTSSNVSPQSSFPIQLSFDVDGTEPSLSGNIQLKSQMRMDLANERYTFENVTLNGRAQLPDMADQAQSANLKIAKLSADTRAQQYRADGLQLGASLYHHAMQETPLSLDLALNAVADLTQDTAALTDLTLTGDDGLDLSGEMDLTQLTTMPRYAGRLTLAPLSLRDWLTRFGVAIDSADDKALTALSMNATFQGDPNRVDFQDLDLTLDQTHFQGALGAAFDGRTLEADLHGDRLDLDAYLPPAQAGVESPPQTDDEVTAGLATLGISPALAATEDAALLPTAWLGELTQEGRLRFDELKIKGANLSDVALETSGSSGRQRIDSLSAKLYDGSLEASGALDLRQMPLTLSFTERLQGVAVAPFYQDISGKASPLRGTLDLQGDFGSRTNTLEGLKQNLDGQAALSIDQGAMLDVNVSRQLCTAVAALEGRESTREWSEDTAFDRLSASVTVDNGVVHNDDLDIAIPGIEVTGKGDVNLVTNRLDYRAAARFVDTADEAACGVNPRLAKIDFPIRCEGSLSDEPSQWCGFDRDAFQASLGELAKDEAKRKAGERVEEALDERLDDDTRRKIDGTLGEGATDELRDKLRGLFQ